jgi:hypothetical protein
LRRLPLLLLVILAGCLGDVPRDNPLDPLSPAYDDAGTLDGTVTGIYPPFEGRADVRIHLVPLDGEGTERLARTAADGAYRLAGIPAGRYEIRAERDGFRPAVDTTVVIAGGATTLQLQLDALPVVVEQSMRTVHIERWFPDQPLFQLEVEAEATDPDRASDVESAALVAEALGFRAALAEVEPGRFRATLNAADLPGGRVQSLLGQALRIEVTDRAGNAALGPPLALVRVIEQTPLTARPQGLELAAQNPPVLEWRPADLPFAFTYRVDVFLVDGGGLPNLIHTAEGLPATATTYALPTALASGDHYWTLWAVDASGNRSRSKEAGFRVP